MKEKLSLQEATILALQGKLLTETNRIVKTKKTEKVKRLKSESVDIATEDTTVSVDDTKTEIMTDDETITVEQNNVTVEPSEEAIEEILPEETGEVEPEVAVEPECEEGECDVDDIPVDNLIPEDESKHCEDCKDKIEEVTHEDETHNDTTLRNFKFDDEDINFVKEKLGPVFNVEVKDDNATLDISLVNNEYIDGGIVNITDKFSKEFEEFLKQKEPDISLNVINHGTTYILTQQIVESKEVKTESSQGSYSDALIDALEEGSLDWESVCRELITSIPEDELKRTSEICEWGLIVDGGEFEESKKLDEAKSVTQEEIDELDKFMQDGITKYNIPSQGKASSKEGEWVRTMNRILYSFYNNGDKAYVGYNNGQNDKFDDLVDATDALNNSELTNLVDTIAGTNGDKTYENKLYRAIAKFKELVSDDTEKVTESEDDEIVTVNPEDEQYSNNKYIVSIPVSNFGCSYYVYANNEQEALEKLVAYLEKEAPGLLTDEEDFEDGEDEQLNYMYIDGTPYGATKPHYMDISTVVKKVDESKKLNESKEFETKEELIKYIVDNFKEVTGKYEVSELFEDPNGVMLKDDDFNPDRVDEVYPAIREFVEKTGLVDLKNSNEVEDFFTALDEELLKQK